MILSWRENSPTELKEKIDKVDKVVEPRLGEIDEQVFCNQQRVLDLFGKHRVGKEDLVSSTGYGYDDIGRGKLEATCADYFKTNGALVRPQFSPTAHAITVGLFSMLHPGGILYYLAGMPYDTTQGVIGLAGSKPRNMKGWGINFKRTDLLDNGEVDYDQARRDLQDLKIRIVTIQRSLGYAVRVSFTTEKIRKMFKFIKEARPDVEIFVDSCYGELSETGRPTFYGADMMAGSLFKNAGAGIVKADAFLVSKKDLIGGTGSRFNVLGAGEGEGTTWGYLEDMYQGFFMAPHTTGGALKGMIYTATLCEEMGMRVVPEWNNPRTDIIQAVTFREPDPVVKPCAAIQHYSPVNPFVDPIPYHQDGYKNDIVMASGSFTEGSTTELFSDNPLRAPCRLYIQGGLSYVHDKVTTAHAVEGTFYKKD